jgi:hypothetical protein
MDAANHGWRRLGAVLLEAGLVGEQDLADALTEQERSGRRLGEILVGRGLLSAAAVANALAEQHGRFLKTEHGFGTGLRASVGPGSGPEPDATPPEAPPLSSAQPPEHALEETSAVAADSTVFRKPIETEPVATLQAMPPKRQSEGDLEAERQPPPQLEHLLFVPTYQGYLLLQRSGTAPLLGDILELPESPGTRLVVSKLALSPLPQDRRVCAYLGTL